MIIGIDFDGTIVEHEFPDIGEAVPGALPVMRYMQDHGHKIILWTMRSDKFLDQAVYYLRERGIVLYGINRNPGVDWSTSPKAYAHVYIDDAALGCPLIENDHRRPYVDWRTCSRPAGVRSRRYRLGGLMGDYTDVIVVPMVEYVCFRCGAVLQHRHGEASPDVHEWVLEHPWEATKDFPNPQPCRNPNYQILAN